MPARWMRWSPPTGWTAAQAQSSWPKPWSRPPKSPANFKFLYPLDLSIKEKIEIICKEIYGADGVDYLPEAEAKIDLYTRLGFDKLPHLHGQDPP